MRSGAEASAEGIPALAGHLLALLHDQAEVQTSSPAPAYEFPDAPYFGSYLVRLEQLLAVRCSGMDGVPTGFLSGEREIIDGNLQLCLEFPENVSVRILLTETLRAMKRARPEILPEFKEKIALLVRVTAFPFATSFNIRCATPVGGIEGKIMTGCKLQIGFGLAGSRCSGRHVLEPACANRHNSCFA